MRVNMLILNHIILGKTTIHYYKINENYLF
uniref:Uncharacterized protein n=1 Tax=Rhizophora mucronata TaxID=61149 RepID=A0A2P2NHW0_RHIMU